MRKETKSMIGTTSPLPYTGKATVYLDQNVLDTAVKVTTLLFLNR